MNETVNIRRGIRTAVLIGVICIFSYIVNYYLRNMLSVFTPELLADGRYSEVHVGLLSSVYMFFYAGGQLINGFIGDIVSPKKMILAGIGIGGVATAVFPLIGNRTLELVCFAVLGFGLSMVRGPLMKVISENTSPRHARFICVFFSFASFVGPVIASIFSLLLDAHIAFTVAGIIAVFSAMLSFLTLSLMERKGCISYKKTDARKLSSIFGVFKIEKFGFYMIIACLVEIAVSSVGFWIPTYLTNYLYFSTDVANMIYSIVSICRACMPFVSLMIFNAIGEKDIPMMRVCFTLSAVLFVAMLFVRNTWANIVLLILALMAMGCCSALLWSIYIPGLGATGRASSVNGVLDCTGYVAAALANLLFSSVMTNVGWKVIIMLWASMGAIGFAATFIVRKKKNTNS